MDPKQFTATSGNRVIHITDLGPDGKHAAWDRKPSDRDRQEFEEWMASRTGRPELTRHNGGR